MKSAVTSSLKGPDLPGFRRGMSGVVSLVMFIAVCMGSFVVYRFAFTDPTPMVPASSLAKDATDVDVDVDEVRIATLLPFAADQLLQMGAQPVCIPGLRGRAPEGWEGIPSVQLDHSAGPNLEQLIAVNPDYIITGSTYAQFMPHIESVTGSKIVVMDVNSIASVMENIRILGEIAGREQEAEGLVSSLEARLAPPMDLIGEDQQIDVLAVFGTPHSFYAFLPDSYLGDLVHHAGGRMGPEGLTSHKVYRGLAPLSMEMVVEFDPDLLLVLFHGPEETSRAMFEGDPLWGSLGAVHEGRMQFLSDDLYAMRPGSQLDRAILEIHGHVKSVSDRSE